jgi:hypothetical protein
MKMMKKNCEVMFATPDAAPDNAALTWIAALLNKAER